ncbi:MAG: hypothetical protein H0T48_07320 [Gemmatimonadaceae bacterium]|nr:hypothetical protein [Gemmatimonadaceae bacterium]
MSDVPRCKKCGGEVYDNRADKKSPRSPDFRCKDKACAEPAWLDKKKPAERPAKAAESREHYAGPPLPNETPDEATGGKPPAPRSICADWLSALDVVIDKALPKARGEGNSGGCVGGVPEVRAARPVPTLANSAISHLPS